MHPFQQHTNIPHQAEGQGGQTLDRTSNGTVDNEQHRVDRLALTELTLNLPQTFLILHPGLREKRLRNSFTVWEMRPSLQGKQLAKKTKHNNSTYQHL